VICRRANNKERARASAILLALAVAPTVAMAEPGGKPAVTGNEFYALAVLVTAIVVAPLGLLTAVVLRRAFRMPQSVAMLAALAAVALALLGWLSGALPVLVGLLMWLLFGSGRTM